MSQLSNLKVEGLNPRECRTKMNECSPDSRDWKCQAILVIVSNSPGQLDINNFTSTTFQFKHGQHSTIPGLKNHPLFQTSHLEVSHDSPGPARCGDRQVVGEQAAAVERPAAVGEPARGQRWHILLQPKETANPSTNGAAKGYLIFLSQVIHVIQM
jgi:hypothetical protein